MDLPNPNVNQAEQDWLDQQPKGDGSLGSMWNSMSSYWSDWWNNSALNPGNFQKKIRDFLGISNVQDSINSASSQGKIAYTKTGIPYDESNTDSQINALMQEYANKRDDESYDRLIVALKRNGINPVLALSNSATPMSSDSGYRSNYNLTSKDQINSALKAGSILALLLGLLMKK